MLFKGVAEEGGEFVTSLMLVLVVLLGFDWLGARRGARGVGVEGAIVRVAAKLAGASLLDESEGQVFVVVEVIQDLGVRVTERTISGSLEGSHEDGLQNVFNGEVTNVAQGATRDNPSKLNAENQEKAVDMAGKVFM
jgi:hypothetical protein